MRKYIDEILQLANKAYKNDEVPIGAIVIYKGKIIGKGYNRKKKTHLVTDHAEIIAINRAAKKMGDWRLDECELYVTLEPCDMCKEAIRQSRIKKVYFIEKSTFNNENNKSIEYVKINTEHDDYATLLSKFFANKR